MKAKDIKFSYDIIGYTEAVKWLKEINQYNYLSTHGQSTDGLSIIHTANSLWKIKNK